jgi:AcrR family transcriptional regulator
MADSDRSYPSVWTRPRRKERSTLTREQIVTEAVRLLDTEGMDALSMRKLAARLEAGATSLYWHVANRDELIELVIDHVYGELDVPGPEDAGDWPAALRRFAHSIRATFMCHRWLVSVLDHLVSAYLGPNLTGVTERMLGLLEAAGFELREAERALSTLSAYVTGISLAEAAWHDWLERHGQTPEQWVEAGAAVAGEVSEAYPKLREIVASYQGIDPQKSADEDFDYGLDRFLDGLQTRLDQQQQGTT